MQISQAQMNILKLTDYFRKHELPWDIRISVYRLIRSLKVDGADSMGSLAGDILKIFQENSTEESLQRIEALVLKTEL